MKSYTLSKTWHRNSHWTSMLKPFTIKPIKQVRMGPIVASSSGKALFAATCEPGRPSSLRAYKLPLTGDFVEYQCHAGPATRKILV